MMPRDREPGRTGASNPSGRGFLLLFALLALAVAAGAFVAGMLAGLLQ